MIALNAATVALGGRPVLHDIAFAAAPGELVALCGPNGAGKSTLLRALAGLLPGLPRPDPRRLAYLPQDARCAWGLTVAEVAALGRIPHGDRDPAAIAEALATCGLTGLAGARIDRVSGGQAHRAMLARVLATRAGTLILDEPTADLDPSAGHEIMALLRCLAREGRAVVVVLHALDLALRYADRLVVLEAGRIVADAAPLAALPEAARAFGLPFGTDASPRLLPPG